MIINTLAVGPLMANCFILGCEKTLNAAVIDPGDDVDQILLSLAESKFKLNYIINTHGHFDHAGGNNKLKLATKASILIHKLDAPMLVQLANSASHFGLSVENSPAPDKLLEDDDLISFGNITLKVIHTPGHSPGGISLFHDGSLFVGDTLFAGSIGRTDFEGGDYDQLINSVQKKLFLLGDDTKVYTGHGGETTIGQEKSYNPFVRLS